VNLEALLRAVDAPTARAFVTAARSVIDALMIEAQRVQQAQAPQPRDYERAGLDRSAPGGGWLSDEALRDATRSMAEAIAAERWLDGVAATIRVLTLLGGL